MILQSEVVQKLGRRGAVWLEVPSLIELHVMAGLDDARLEVNVVDIMVCGRISQEDYREITMIKFARTVAGPLDADRGTKYLEPR